jgi:hypothetical protein
MAENSAIPALTISDLVRKGEERDVDQREQHACGDRQPVGQQQRKAGDTAGDKAGGLEEHQPKHEQDAADHQGIGILRDAMRSAEG